MKIRKIGVRSFVWIVVAAGLLTSAGSTQVLAQQAGEGWRIVQPGDGSKQGSEADIVVEGGGLRVVISAQTGRATVYTIPAEKKRAEIDSAPMEGRPQSIRVVDTRAGTLTVALVWDRSGVAEDTRAVLSFRPNGIVEVAQHEGLVLHSPMAYAIIPSFMGGDLVYSPAGHPPTDVLHLPAEQMLLGLLDGEDDLLAITWDNRDRTPTPLLSKVTEQDGPFGSLEFQKAVGSITLAFQHAPGIWHREALGSSFLERDVTVGWQRPFPAKWKTQLYEDGVRTTYTFRASKKKRFWRGAFGTYTYPVWFDGERAIYRLGKKIPPKGESLIYFVEGTKDTPDSVMPPADFVRQSLGDPAYQRFIDREGREKTQDGRPDHCVGTATCGVTDKLKPVLEEGKEVERRDYVESGILDMKHHLGVLTKRVHHYQEFGRDMLAYLEAVKQKEPQLSRFVDEMIETTGGLAEAYEAQKENIKTLEYSEALGKETAALAQEKRHGNLAAFLKLKGRWTGMGGALEGMVRRLHTVARDLSQRAGYGCVDQPEAVTLAREIRRRVYTHLRNPIGYEMWSSD